MLLLPKEIQIEPTVRCNMNCIMCDEKARNRAPDMTLENFKQIVNQKSIIKPLKHMKYEEDSIAIYWKGYFYGDFF